MCPEHQALLADALDLDSAKIQQLRDQPRLTLAQVPPMPLYRIAPAAPPFNWGRHVWTLISSLLLMGAAGVALWFAYQIVTAGK